MLDALLPGVGHLQNLHPLIVHFPVALLTGAVVLYGLAWVTRWHAAAVAARWFLVLGTLGAAAAVATGLYAEDGVMIARSVRAELLVPHKRCMLATLGLSVLLSAWALLGGALPARARPLFLLLLLVLLGVVTVGADYGGRMVYDYNAGGDACSQPIDFTR